MRRRSHATSCHIANRRETAILSGQEPALNSRPTNDHHRATAVSDFVDEETPLPPAVPSPLPSETSAKLYDQLVQDEPPPDRNAVSDQ
jgi:hypothetical protein